ncbi:MAG TPA: hypothetical protein VFA15_01630, partial [Nitrososphaera sp.]|nr:hypothetical protein [Nitrososphaera sp.]
HEMPTGGILPKTRRQRELSRSDATNELIKAERAQDDLGESVTRKVLNADVALERQGADSEYRYKEQLALGDARHREGDPERHQRHLSFLDRLSESARSADERAKAKGEWAALLHEHPLGDAFKASLPGVYGFDTPYELWDLETNILEKCKRQAEEDRSKLEETKAMGFSLDDALEMIKVAGKEIGNESDQDILEEFFAESRGMVKELLQKLKIELKDDMTVGDIKARAKEIAGLVISIEECEADGMERALGDIRAGRADDPAYHVMEVPTDEQAAHHSREAERHIGEAEKWHKIAEERKGKERTRASDIADIHARYAIEAAERAGMAPGEDQEVDETPDV